MPKQKTKIPEGWREVKLGEIIKFQGGFAFKTAEYKDGGVPLVRIGNVGKGYFDATDFVYLSEDAFNEQKQFQLQAGDTLMGMTGDLGKVCKIEERHLPALLNQRVGRVIIKNKKESNGDFIYQVFSSTGLHAKFEKHFEGMAQKNISPSQVESVEILLPPLATQNKIAEILGVVDEEIEKVDGVVEKSEKLKNGLTKDLFTKGIGHTKFKKTKHGELPVEWDVKQLKDLTTKIGDGLHGTPGYSDDSSFYFINGNNIADKKINIYSETKAVSEDVYYLHKKDLGVSTIFLSINGTIGNVGFFNNEKVVLGKSIAYINCGRSVIKEFVAYQIQADKIKSYYVKNLTGTTIKNLSLGTIRETPIIVPPINEQKKIVDFLSVADDKISIYKKIKNNLIQLKKGLMADLLSGKTII